jgi:hypothetical protein
MGPKGRWLVQFPYPGSNLLSVGNLEPGRRDAVAVLKPRERLVYFRISEDEFRQFVSVCEQEGARSVSDLARSAVQRLIADGDRQRNGEELEQKMHRLEELIMAVAEQLRLLTATRMRESGMVDMAASTEGRSALAASADDGREQ